MWNVNDCKMYRKKIMFNNLWFQGYKKQLKIFPRLCKICNLKEGVYQAQYYQQNNDLTKVLMERNSGGIQNLLKI